MVAPESPGLRPADRGPTKVSARAAFTVSTGAIRTLTPTADDFELGGTDFGAGVDAEYAVTIAPARRPVAPRPPARPAPPAPGPRGAAALRRGLDHRTIVLVSGLLAVAAIGAGAWTRWARRRA
jgi:hypothetical protein